MLRFKLFLALAVAFCFVALGVAPALADPLQITTATNHTGYVSLQGYRIPTSTTGECISLSNSPAKTGPVNFYLDSQTTIYHTENTAPWDMLSGGTNDATGACRLGTIATGNHYVKATWGGGGTDQESFTVGPVPNTVIASFVDHDSNTFLDEDGNGSEQVDVTFSGTNSANRFDCSMSGATVQAWAPCTSVWTPIVNVGDNVLSLRACDNAGCDPSPSNLIFPMGACSNCDTTAPDTTITSAPSGATSSTSASIGFTGTDNVGVASFECKLDAGAYAACTSPKLYSGLTDGSHTVSVRAKDAAGNVDATPAIATWTVDATAPNTTIDSGPSGATNNASPSFAFSSTESGSFECRIDGAAFASCTSPQAYTALTDGSHTFDVRAIDAVGNVDASPASRSFTVDTVVPDTTITAQPSNPTTSTNADFSFTSSETATFQCSLDGAAYATCTSPKSYTGLSIASHTFTVKATDAASNTDATPASYTWTVNAPAGDPLVSTGDPATASSQEAARPPSLAFDQNSTTRWGSILDGAGGTGHDNEWIYVDLGQNYNISRVLLNWEAAYATAYKIQVSSNASTWTDAYSTTTGNGAIDDLTFTASGRYVRMLGVTRATQWGYSLWEMEVYGVAAAPPAPQCSDGVDNADPEDTIADYPADPGCTDANDDDETNPSGPTPPPAPGTWHQTFNDDFDSVDTNKWGFKFWWGGDGFWPTKELQVYRQDHCTSSGGILNMTATKETPPIQLWNGSTVNSAGEQLSYYSCWMSTGGQRDPVNVPAKYLFQYGYAEARIKFGKGQGIWPGFWMQGRDSTNGTSFDDGHEIDIVEIVGKEPYNVQMNYHGPSGGFGGAYTMPNPVGDDYHVFAVDWEPGKIDWYVDGVLRQSLTRSDVPTTPRYVMLNHAVGGATSWPGAPDASTVFPVTTKVDWVHVWQKN